MRSDLNWKPERLDVEAFARESGVLEGQWPVDRLPRWFESQWQVAGGAPLPPIAWRLQGERRERLGSAAEIWLHLSAQAGYRLECQRCLQSLEAPVQVEAHFRFVRDEALAEAEDPDSEEDLLVLTRALDAVELIEDELLLSLPIVPLHDECEPPAPLVSEEEEVLEERPNPFAALAALKKKG